MAKRLIDWNLSGSTLTMGEYIDSETPAKMLESFDLKKLFFPPEDFKVIKNKEGEEILEYNGFLELTEVQQFLFVYGIKQKLADAGSSAKVATEKAKIAKAKFTDFVNGKLTGERSNSTGVKAMKKIFSDNKANSEVISLKGLMTKQLLFPDTFTVEDEKKLKEFLKMTKK